MSSWSLTAKVHWLLLELLLEFFSKAYTHNHQKLQRIWKTPLLGRHVFPVCLRVPEAPWLQTWFLFLGSMARIHMAAELHLGQQSAIPQSVWKAQIAERQMQATLSWNNMKKTTFSQMIKSPSVWNKCISGRTLSLEWWLNFWTCNMGGVWLAGWPRYILDIQPYLEPEPSAI